jgi:hypothetical protein
MQAFTDESGVPAAAALDAGAEDAGAAEDAAAGALLAAAGALDAAAGALDAAAAGALADAGALELELDLLLLHAVSATATIPVAATTWMVLLTMPPLEFRCLSPGETDPRTIGACRMLCSRRLRCERTHRAVCAQVRHQGSRSAQKRYVVVIIGAARGRARPVGAVAADPVAWVDRERYRRLV